MDRDEVFGLRDYRKVWKQVILVALYEFKSFMLCKFWDSESVSGSGEVACLSLGGQIHRLPPPPPPSPTHTHTNTHAAFLSEFLISLQGRIQDFGEEGVGSTWIIDASTTGRGAREARENFCGAFSTELRQSIVPSVRAAR